VAVAAVVGCFGSSEIKAMVRVITPYTSATNEHCLGDLVVEKSTELSIQEMKLPKTNMILTSSSQHNNISIPCSI
jgi:hypothetical protein